MKRRQRGVRAGLMSIERAIWGAEAFGLVEGNTGDGATGESWSGPTVSKTPCTHTRLSPGPHMDASVVKPRPAVLERPVCCGGGRARMTTPGWRRRDERELFDVLSLSYSRVASGRAA